MPGVVKLNPDAVIYDESGHPVGITLDGSVYRLQTETKMATGHGLSTESKQDSLLTELQKKADLTETQPISAASLPLPTGAATSAKQDTILTELQQKTEPNDYQRIKLYDALENALETMVDEDGDRRLRVQSNFPPGQSILVGNQMPATLSYIQRSYALNGVSNNLAVNGSVTPVNFDYSAIAGFDLAVYEIRFIFGAQDIPFDGNSFATLTALTNGLKVEMTYGNGLETVELANIKTNEDFLMFPSPANTLLNNTGPKDILVAGIFIGGGAKLKANTTDRVRVIVRDNLTSVAISTLKVQIFALKE